MATVGRKSLHEGEETRPLTIRLCDSTRLQVEYHALKKKMGKSEYIRYCISEVIDRDTGKEWNRLFSSEEALRRTISEAVKDAMLVKDKIDGQDEEW